MRTTLTTLILLVFCCWTTAAVASPTPLHSRAPSLVGGHHSDQSAAQASTGIPESMESPLQARSPCKWLKDKIKGCFRPPPPRGRGRVVVDNYRTQELMVLSQQAHDRDHGTIGIGGVQRAWRCKSRGTCVHAYSQQFEPPPPQSDEDE